MPKHPSLLYDRITAILQGIEDKLFLPDSIIVWRQPFVCVAVVVDIRGWFWRWQSGVFASLIVRLANGFNVDALYD
jgi:hypothetical protein